MKKLFLFFISIIFLSSVALAITPMINITFDNTTCTKNYCQDTLGKHNFTAISNNISYLTDTSYCYRNQCVRAAFGLYNTSDFNYGPNISMCTFVRSEAPPSGGTAVIFAHYDTNGQRGFRFDLLGSSIPLSPRILLSGIGTALNKTYNFSSNMHYNNTWYHYCFTYDGNNNLTVYVNGSEVTPTKTTDYPMTTIFDANIPLTIGGSWATYPTASSLANGQYIDELLVWNASLNSSEIASIYQSYQTSSNACTYSGSGAFIQTASMCNITTNIDLKLNNWTISNSNITIFNVTISNWTNRLIDSGSIVTRRSV